MERFRLRRRFLGSPFGLLNKALASEDSLYSGPGDGDTIILKQKESYTVRAEVGSLTQSA